MAIIDIMTPHVVAVSANDTLQSALSLMDQHNIRHLPVMEPDGRLVGIVSDRDCDRALQSPFIPDVDTEDDIALTDRVLIKFIMSPAPVWIDPFTTIQEAANIMVERRINCLPVLRDKTLVGIITSTDLLRVLVSDPS